MAGNTTYLNIVNSVLTRLRESTVTTLVGAQPYPALIGLLVNDAKREIEDAWQWLSLADSVVVPVTAGTSTYNLNLYNGTFSGAPMRERARIRRDLKQGKFMVFNTTKNFEALLAQYQYDTNTVLAAQAANNAFTSPPSSFGLQPLPNVANWVDGLINRQLLVYPVPDINYTIQIFFTNPTDILVNDTDLVFVPRETLEQKAYLFALYERGEEMGESLGITKVKVDQVVGDAIAHDQSMQSEQAGFVVNDAMPSGSNFFYSPT